MKSISRRHKGQSRQPTTNSTRARGVADAHLVEARSVADRQPEDCRREVRLIRKSPSRKNYRHTYQVRVPHGSIPVFMIKAFEAATKDKLCCLPGLRLRLREETACSQTVSMALIPGVQAELA
jgi:hypothetical protein